MRPRTIVSVIFAFVLSLTLVLIPTTQNESPNKAVAVNMKILESARAVYRVYLEGNSIGVVESKKELEDYIDKEQESIKKKYKVDKVFAPNDLDIVKEYTYKDEVSTAKEIYQKIREIKGSEAFTINGYKIFIGGVEVETEEGTVKTDDIVFYALDKDVVYEAMERTIKAFISDSEYKAYLNDTQPEINYTGKRIENLYIENEKKITQERIPTGEMIYTDVDTLSQFLLFGTLNQQKQYTVKEGDTIEEISFNNEISTEEFLVANTNFSSSKDLLYVGQVVTLGVLNPQFRVVEEDYVVKEQSVNYETKYENDNTQYVGYEKVKQEGQNGLSVVTQIQKKVNGETIATTTTNETVIKPSVDRVIIRGTRQYSTSGGWGTNYEVPVGIGSWVWPTQAPYTITSPFGWRWGKLHEGTDISGCGYGSPIKAANNGVVVESKYDGYNGNYIIIKHSNNYHTMYAHLATRYKQAGDVVLGGDVIGLMGNSGFAQGTHLHFQVSTAYPITANRSMFFNPLTLYR